MEERKKALIIAKLRKLEILLAEAFVDKQTDLSALNSAYDDEFMRYQDLGDIEHLSAHVTVEMLRNNHGKALQSLNKFISDNYGSPKALSKTSTILFAVVDQVQESQTDAMRLIEIRKKLLKELKWELWEQYESQWNIRRFPTQGHSPF